MMDDRSYEQQLIGVYSPKSDKSLLFTTLEFVTSNFWYGVSLRPPGLPPPGISECDVVCYDVVSQSSPSKQNRSNKSIRMVFVWLLFPRFEHIKPYKLYKTI